MSSFRSVFLLGPLCFGAVALGQTHHMDVPAPLGHVPFSNSCASQVQADMSQGLSLLYSFWYDEARKRFSAVLERDPQCAMAYWGEAMSYYQPVETLPEGQQLLDGQRAIAAAANATTKTSREASLISALAIIFDTNTRPKSSVRAEAYSAALEELHGQYSSDHVVSVLYALSLLSPELPDDPTHIRARRAVALLNEILHEEPDNPGVMHFIIHASDNPQMASEALFAARRYAEIAPASAHALHMPSHIFARLGYWQDDIHSNLASKAAAERHSSMHTGSENRLHAMEFLEYAYLQTGREDKAQAIVDEARTIKASDLDPGFESYYSWVEASLPIRLALETRNWQAALAIDPPPKAGPYTLRVVYWANAVAAGHLQNSSAADQALSRYLGTFSASELTEEERNPSAQFVETRAWSLFAKGDLSGAEALLRPAADHQDKVGKGEVELPAREMLADMLRASDKPVAALQEYRASLQTDPGRFNTLLHAGETAESLHLNREARADFTALLRNAPDPAPGSKKVIAAAMGAVGRSASDNEHSSYFEPPSLSPVFNRCGSEYSFPRAIGCAASNREAARPR